MEVVLIRIFLFLHVGYSLRVVFDPSVADRVDLSVIMLLINAALAASLWFQFNLKGWWAFRNLLVASIAVNGYYCWVNQEWGGVALTLCLVPVIFDWFFPKL